MKQALLVIDMQNDFLWEQRKPQFSYKDVDGLVARVNGAIRQYQTNGAEIVYIAQIVQNIWTNRLLFGFALRGTEGAKLYSKLEVTSRHYFEKSLPSAFSSKAFAAFMDAGQYDSVAICGIDEGGCVSATAKAAAKRGLKVTMLTDCVDTSFPLKKVEKLRAQLRGMGVVYQPYQSK